MATKPLKTLTFEGLNDTYTVPQVDATLSVTGGAADAKATGDTLAEKADKDGVIATAEGLIGGAYTVEKEPYHFRKTAVDLAGRLDETIVGGSLGWNQLCNGSSVTVTSGHKYYMKKASVESIGASDGTALTGLTSGTDMVIDLTILFGSATIADHIYTLEQATEGSGVAWVKQYIDLDSYHAYSAPTIKSVEGLVSHDMVGWNQWDEEWEVGAIDARTGQNTTGSNTIRTKNYIHVFPNANYCITAPFGYAFYYDSNKNYLGYEGTGVTDDGRIHTTVKTIPSNACYVRFRFTNDYGTTYNHDICINLSDQSRNGQYEPYESHTYSLDSSIVLRGVLKLDSNNNLYYDGDVYPADGQGTRRFWRVILTGTESWALEGSLSDRDNNPTSRFYIVKNDMLKPSGSINTRDYIGRMISTVPTLKGGYVTQFSMTNIEMGVTGYQGEGSSNYLYLIVNNTINTTITTVDALKSWLASHPLEIVYELATPTTFTAQPFQSPMIVGATEEYISDSVVPVGHESKYYEDVAKKVSGLPKDFSTLIAPVEVTFTATRNYSVGSYLIVKNQLYKVTSAISSGGTITPNSNVTATTIMAEILALA